MNELFQPAGQAGTWLSVAGDGVRTLARAEDTRGAFAMFEVVVPPGGGPPPHTHNREDEAFFIIEGQLVFELGGQRRTVAAGDFLLAPRGRRHSYHNHSGEAARMLVQASPAGLERFFEQVGVRVDGPFDLKPPTLAELERVLRTAEDFGVEIHTAGA